MQPESLIKEILDAQYEADYCAPKEQAAKAAKYFALLDKAIEGTPCSRMMLVEALKERYKAYRNGRRKKDGIPHGVKNLLTEDTDPLAP